MGAMLTKIKAGGHQECSACGGKNNADKAWVRCPEKGSRIAATVARFVGSRRLLCNWPVFPA
ncbi:hypothetical protein GCM10010970_15960 [Silvimonas iriomotensis]|uniref:Uncharacterized protein n=1 Tax=Silvimonas iriomotensis TaxID=449662 RepID=A0ABQ2P884_9NEIS|nr:hypothetical protein GCM10010970_15960 [Silvimonas iriomotensis]